MKKATIVVGALSFFIGSVLLARHNENTLSRIEEAEKAGKISSNATNQENFDKMMDVLTSERCVNCHPNDKIPKQGDDSHPHFFGITGGEDNHGYTATVCSTCHQDENNDYSGVPGAPEWSLAPPEMMWEGLSREEIAASMLDPKINGGRNLKELEHHLTAHELVLWAWEPGISADGTPRTLPPVPLDEYIEAVKNWIEDGAIIPSQ